MPHQAAIVGLVTLFLCLAVRAAVSGHREMAIVVVALGLGIRWFRAGEEGDGDLSERR
jgi:hypothetical protein